MQLKVNRSQKKGGLFGNKIIYQLDVMVDYSPEEKELINSQKYGGKLIYQSTDNEALYNDFLEHSDDMSAAGLTKNLGRIIRANFSLKITVASLARGHHLEATELNDIVEAENGVIAACKELKQYLANSTEYKGGEHVIEI